MLRISFCLADRKKYESETRESNQRPEGRIRGQARNQRPERQNQRPDARITPLRIRDQTGPNQRPGKPESETRQG